MRMLRVAMRHQIESGGSSECKNVLCFVGLVLIAFAAIARAEGPAHVVIAQSGSMSGGESKAVSPKGIPPHAPGYLGILFADLSEEQASLLHFKGVGGVEVINVDHDGPAGKVLQAHDVILKLNGQIVVSAEMLRRMIRDAGVGADVALLVVRGGKQVTVKAQLAYRGEVERQAMARMVLPEAPAGDDAVVSGFVETYEVGPVAPSRSERAPGFLAQMLHTTPFTGMVVDAVAPQLAGFFGSSTGGGLLVETVAVGSPAAAAGLRAGDVVERADSIAVRSTSDWVKRLHASKGQAISLIVLRDKREISMTLIPQLKKHSKLEWPVGFGAMTLVG
jgi:serine protease Do